MQQNSQRSVQSLFNVAVCTTEEVVCWVGWLLCMKMLAVVGLAYVGWMCVISCVMLREFSVVADL